MDERQRDDELLRRLDEFEQQWLRPLGIRLKLSANMLRPSRRRKLAEKLFAIYCEHGIRDAYELFVDLGLTSIAQLLGEIVPEPDLEDWLTRILFEFHNQRIDLNQGFEEGLREFVLFLKLERPKLLSQVLARETEFRDRYAFEVVCDAFVQQLGKLRWRTIEILCAIFVDGKDLAQVEDQFDSPHVEQERAVESLLRGTEAILRRQDSSDDHGGKDHEEQP